MGGERDHVFEFEGVRYIVKYGVFGAYFYDTEDEKRLTLMDVVEILNKFDESESVV